MKAQVLTVMKRLRSMNTKTIALITAVLLAVTSCLEFQDKNPSMTSDEDCLWVDLDMADTRVYVDGVKTLLNSEDLFSVFHQSNVNEKWIYFGEDGTTNGKLILSENYQRKTEFPHIYSVYPWSESASISGNTICTTLPEVQFFNKTSYGRGAAVLAAVTDINTLHFRYASGFICLSLKGNAQIQSITLSSNGEESLAGACKIEIMGGKPHLKATGSSSVIMRNLDFSPMTVDGSVDFIFSVAPATYQNGISFKITYTNGQEQHVNVTSPVTVCAGVVSAPIESTCQTQMMLEANFITDGQSAINPFATSISKDIIPDNSGYTSESADVFLLNDINKEYPFRFYITNKDNDDNLRITKSGLNFGGTVGDYIKFPGVEGMTLSAARLTSATQCLVSVNSQASTTVEASAPTTIHIKDIEPGQPCKMEMCSAAIAKFSNITLYYDNAL